MNRLNAGVAKVAHIHFLAEFAFREKVFAPNAKEMLFAVWVEDFNFPFFFVSFFCGCLGAIVADLLVAVNGENRVVGFKFFFAGSAVHFFLPFVCGGLLPPVGV